MDLFFGTYTRPAGHLKGAVNEGIPHYWWNDADGRLEKVGVVPFQLNPSFLGYDAHRGVLYATAETDDQSGDIVGFRRQESGEWRAFTRVSGIGAHCCHLNLDTHGEYIFVTSYSGASVGMLRRDASGAVKLVHRVELSGQSVHPERQNGPHPHSSLLERSGKWLLVADLGTDRIRVFAVDRDCHRLEPQPKKDLSLSPGSGPRHLTWSPDRRSLLVLFELKTKITVFRFADGMKPDGDGQSYSLSPDRSAQLTGGAEITCHPCKPFVYASVRGRDSIMAFRISQADGALELIQEVRTGTTPRHFAISPNGRWLIVAHQNAGTIQVWRIAESGALILHGDLIEEKACSCVCFAH
jgi:6-phosphogluconolactonase